MTPVEPSARMEPERFIPELLVAEPAVPGWRWLPPKLLRLAPLLLGKRSRLLLYID